MENNLYLVFVEPIGKNSQEMYEYEFIFSDMPDMVWGEDWAEQCPAACENMRPGSDMITLTKRLATIIPLGVAQNNTCFSMQDCIDGIISLAWEDMSEYDEYPEPIRLIFKFGEDMKSVEDKLAMRHQFFMVKNAEDASGTTEEETDLP